MKIMLGKRKINVPVRKVSFLGKFSGLMFRTRDTDALLFEFPKDTRQPFHSFFVFFPFLMIWLDGENKAIGFRKVRPFTFIIRQKSKFRKVVEVPFNAKNEGIIDFFVGKLGKV
jgi:uncharacterized membrane protein (UPF0127 family)